MPENTPSSTPDTQTSAGFFRRARQVLAGAVGHDLRYADPTPLYVSRAKGGRKWDVDGREYVDFLMGNGALMLGHAQPDVISAIQAAAESGTHFGNDHPLHLEWAETVQRLVPSAERVRFTNSGTEATLLALRIARAFTGKRRVLRFAGHFHGWHDELIHGADKPFDALGSAGTHPHARDCAVMLPDTDPDRVADLLGNEPDIAAAILEPTGASWGRVPLAPDRLTALREVTARHRVLLIFDEVISGFRLSPGGIQQLAGVTPDLTTLAKILAGGMPGGAVVGRSDIMSVFDYTGDAQRDRRERIVHFGTFNAAPLSAAAGVATLTQIADGRPLRRANEMADRLRRRLTAVLDRHGIAGYVYGETSLFHVYFETDERVIAAASRPSDLHTSDPQRLKGMPALVVKRYQQLLRQHGVDIMSSTGGALSSAHTEADISDAERAFDATIQALLSEGLISQL